MILCQKSINIPESNEEKGDENEQHYEDYGNEGCLDGATLLFWFFMALILFSIFIGVEKAN